MLKEFRKNYGKIMQLKNKIRNCPLCDNLEYKSLFTQAFKGHFSHHIVRCNNCGFVFVRNTPNQKYYNLYYKEESKYEGVRQHEPHEEATRSEIIKFLGKNMQKDIRILDIGCSTASLLADIKDKGYKNLFGIDPAPKCKTVAKQKYNIDIETVDLNNFRPSNKYDFIIISQVLEHLIDVKTSLKKAHSLLNDKGHIFIGVPDAGRFYLDFDEPYGEFSTEHINFFTESSFYFLMQNFINVMMKSDNKVLFSIWKKVNDGEQSISEYIRRSKVKFLKIQKIINKLPKRSIVWGAGALTRKLLLTTHLRDKVLFFVDSNQNLIGKSIDHIKIYSPDILEKNHEPVLISSFRFRDEIMKYMKQKKYLNKIYNI